MVGKRHRFGVNIELLVITTVKAAEMPPCAKAK